MLELEIWSEWFPRNSGQPRVKNLQRAKVKVRRGAMQVVWERAKKMIESPK